LTDIFEEKKCIQKLFWKEVLWQTQKAVKDPPEENPAIQIYITG